MSIDIVLFNRQKQQGQVRHASVCCSKALCHTLYGMQLPCQIISSILLPYLNGKMSGDFNCSQNLGIGASLQVIQAADW